MPLNMPCPPNSTDPVSNLKSLSHRSFPVVDYIKPISMADFHRVNTISESRRDSLLTCGLSLAKLCYLGTAPQRLHYCCSRPSYMLMPRFVKLHDPGRDQSNLHLSVTRREHVRTDFRRAIESRCVEMVGSTSAKMPPIASQPPVQYRSPCLMRFRRWQIGYTRIEGTRRPADRSKTVLSPS